MKTFYDALLESFSLAVSDMYVGRMYDRDFIFITEIDEAVETSNLKHYSDFLDAIPKENHQDIARIFNRFIITLSGERQIINRKNEKIKEFKNGRKPNEIITQDLNTALKFKDSLKGMMHFNDSIGTNVMGYGGACGMLSKLEYSPTKSVRDKKSYNIDDLFEVVDLIINDLETKEFKFISKHTYYEHEKPTQQAFKNWLEDVCKEHNINDFKNKVRDLVENLNFK